MRSLTYLALEARLPAPSSSMRQPTESESMQADETAILCDDLRMDLRTPQLSPVVWAGDALQLLDQRLLPEQEQYLTYSDPAQVAKAIRQMVVRGAPAIGITAAYAVVLAAAQPQATRQSVLADVQELSQSRPTAVNLFWALDRMSKLIAQLQGEPSTWLEPLAQEAVAIHEEDRLACESMGLFGVKFIEPKTSVYTHCNAGALATGGQGTSLGVVREAHRQGLLASAYVGETRPWMQGSRLTAWELRKAGIAVCLSTESAAATLFRQRKVQWLIVGADRITRNGDVANKVGTYPLALLARHHGVKVMVVAPMSTIDASLARGEDIVIEQRPAHEVTHWQDRPLAPSGCDAFNPSFDVTPAGLVDVLVTERGAVVNPDEQSLSALLQGVRT